MQLFLVTDFSSLFRQASFNDDYNDVIIFVNNVIHTPSTWEMWCLKKCHKCRIWKRYLWAFICNQSFQCNSLNQNQIMICLKIPTHTYVVQLLYMLWSFFDLQYMGLTDWPTMQHSMKLKIKHCLSVAVHDHIMKILAHPEPEIMGCAK